MKFFKDPEFTLGPIFYFVIKETCGGAGGTGTEEGTHNVRGEEKSRST